LLTSIITFLVGAIGTGLALWVRAHFSQSNQVNTSSADRIAAQEAQDKIDRDARLQAIINEAAHATDVSSALELLRREFPAASPTSSHQMSLAFPAK
jgi:hypothetical protein